MPNQQIPCPHCNNTLEIQSEWAGMNLTCPVCNQIFICPQLSAPKPPAFQAPPIMTQDRFVPQTIPAENLNIHLLKDIISEDYGCKIDKNDTLQINGEYKFYITLIPDMELINFFTFFNQDDCYAIAETRRLANKFNEEKRFLRVSVDDEGSTKCDYYMVYKGGLNTANFKETVEWMNFVVNEWANFYNEE